MERIFTKPLGRWVKGQIADYPIGTWQQIEDSAGEELESFSRLASDAAVESVTKKRKVAA